MKIKDLPCSAVGCAGPLDSRIATNHLKLAAFVLAGLLIPAAAWAQVSYTGTAASENFGSQAIGSTSAARTLSFSVTAGTTVGSIAVVTQGAPNLDFANASGSTCTATTYATATTCTVNVTLKPKSAGLRMGAVVFFSAANNGGTILGKVPVYGIGTGPQIAYGSGVATVIDPTVNGSRLLNPGGAAVNGAGDLYIADSGNNRVVEVPTSGAATALDPTMNGESLVYPADVTVDGAGDLFIADMYNNRVVEVPAGGGAATAIDPTVNGSGLNHPAAVVVDRAGDLFIADYENHRVVEVPAGGGAATAIDPIVYDEGLNLPCSLAVDGAGDLFIGDCIGRVVEVPTGGGAPIPIIPTANGEEIDGLAGVALDAAGDLFVTDENHSRVVEVPVGAVAGDGAGTAIDPMVNGEGLSNPEGVMVDGAGDLFIADMTNNRVLELQHTQPPALIFPTLTFVGATDTTDGTQIVQILNIGNEPLTLSALSYPADFSEASGDETACTGTTSLSAGQECDLPIEFTPENTGALSENVTLTDNALNVAGAQQSIGLSGTGVGHTTASLSATNISWGTVDIGTATGSTSVTLTNTGAAPLIITSISVTGVDASSFVFANTCGTSLAAGANCSIHGHFAPQADGALTAAVTIILYNGTSPQSIALSGTGTGAAIPEVSLSASSLSFGSVNVLTSSASQSVTMTNTGGSALSITSINLTGSGASVFVFANDCGSSLPAAASCTIHGHFAPQTDGAVTAAVTIIDNAGNSPQSITLTGTGTGAEVPIVKLSGTTLSFGPETVGAATDSKSATLTNTGDAVLSISSITVTGADASSFVFANECPPSLSVGASCTIHGHFAPMMAGTLTAAVTITDNAGNSPQSIALSGDGVSQ